MKTAIPTSELAHSRAATADTEHAVALILAEDRLGRPLTVAERHIDIVGLDRDLKEGKARLAAAVEKEKRRALNSYFLYRRTIRMDVTPEMLRVLTQLYRTGRQHAKDEIAKLTGIKLPRSFSEADTLDQLSAKLSAHLKPFEKKVVHQAVSADIGSIAEIAVTRAVLQMPGAVNVASQLVSSAVFAGVGSVYDQSAGLFSAFTYSAVMDDNTCPECEAHEGEEFESWDAIQEVLPDGGPNPDCDGEGRCRCRAVPSGMSAEGALAAGPDAVLPTEGADMISADVSGITGSEAASVAGLGPGQPLVSFAETADYKAFNAAVSESARPGFLTPHTEAELKNGQAFLSEDGKTGFFLLPEGDLQNVFRNEGGVKGSGSMAVASAVQQGARTLDAFDGYLPGLYEQNGFRAVGRMAWNDEFAPAGWDYTTYGRPDVVFMAYKPTSLEVKTFDDFAQAKKYSLDVSTKAEPLGAPPPEFKGLPKHAQQPVSALTAAEARAQIKKLQGNIRGLHWHAKQGKPLNTDKLAVYERRIDELNAHISSGAAPTQTAVRVSAPGTLQPPLDAVTNVVQAKKLASAATSFLEKRTVRADQAKKTIQQRLADRLRPHPDFTESITPRSVAPIAQAKQLGQFAIGDVVEIPAYPGFRYQILEAPSKDAKGLERVAVKVTSGPAGTDINNLQYIRIASGRTAVPVVKEIKTAGKVYKHEFPRAVSRSNDQHEQVTAAMIDKWAGTSADNEPWALAMQQAIRDEFNLAEESLRHFQSNGNWLTAQDIYAEHGAALRAFARAMYDETQYQMELDGVKEVVLYRGQGFPIGEHIPGIHTSADVRLQPASSFSSSYSTASSFQRSGGPQAAGGGIIVARVPAERILGTARTGYGCLNENEFVVLGKASGTTDAMSVEMALPGNIVYKTTMEYWDGIQSAGKGTYAPVAATEIPQEGLTAYIEGLDYNADTIDKLTAVAPKLHLQQNLDEYELNGVFNALEAMPESVIKETAPNGVFVGHGGVSNLDEMTHLKGTEWDKTAGAYQSGKVVVSADLASVYGTSSVNVFLHEFGHAYAESHGLIDLGYEMSVAHKRLAAAGRLSPYLLGPGPASTAGMQETFAEAFATYYSGGYQGVAYKFDTAFADWISSVLPKSVA